MSIMPDGVRVTQAVDKRGRARATAADGAGAEASMSDQVHDALRGDILTCELAPGQPISEASLAARYGFGKAPIPSGGNDVRHPDDTRPDRRSHA